MRRKALDRRAALAKENGISRAAVLELLIRCGKWLNGRRARELYRRWRDEEDP